MCREIGGYFHYYKVEDLHVLVRMFGLFKTVETKSAF